MSRYATADQVRGELCADLDRPAGTAATLSDDQLLDSVDAAGAEIDAALTTAGYRVVAAQDGSFPRLVREVATALAAQDADLAYREGKAQGEGNPVLRRWQWAQQMLSVWAKGERIPVGVTQPGGGDSSDLQVGEAVNTVPDLFGCELLAPSVPPDPFWDPDWYRRLTS